jgi:hypothetical protein
VDDTRPYDSLGGWLIVLALGLMGSLIVLLVGLTKGLLSMTTPGVWVALTSPDSSVYHPMWGPTILFEIGGGIALLALMLVALNRFLRRLRTAPALLIAVLVAQASYGAIDALMKSWLPIEHGEAMTEFGGVVRSLIVATIWIAYVLNSKRVRRTFVN